MERADLREFEELLPEIDYDDILEKTTLEPDFDMCPPWEDADGWEHELVDDPSEGNATGSVNVRGYHSAKLVRLTKPDSWGNYEYHRARGASKQVAAELTAFIQHEAVKQIAKWHNYGYEYYYVACEFKTTDGKAKTWRESVGGILEPDRKYADEVRNEIAGQVADRLEEAGYTVINRPEEESKESNAVQTYRRRDGVNSQNWPGEEYGRAA